MANLKISQFDAAPALDADTLILVVAGGETVKATGAQMRGTPALIVAASTYTGYADYRCDGTDDQVQIQAAIDALGATGGIVQLTPGTYVVAQAGTVTGDTLTTPYCILIDADDGPVTLQGAGMGATTIRLADDQEAYTIPLLVRGASTAKRTNPTTIRGLTIDGNSAEQPDHTDFGMLLVAYADDVTIERVEVIDPPFTGLLIYRDSQSYYVVDCILHQTATSAEALRCESGPGVIYANRLYGDADNAASKPVLSLNANTDVAIVAHDVLIAVNLVTGGHTGIALGGVQRCTVRGNKIQDITHSSGQAVAIGHNSLGAGYSCNHNVITDNEFYNIRHGVRISNGTGSIGSRYNTISGNLMVFGPDVSFGNGVVELGSTITDFNTIRDNVFYGVTTPVQTAGATSARLLRGNISYTTGGAISLRQEWGGTATVASGATSVNVTHSMQVAPTRVQVTPTNSMGNATKFWVTSIGAGTFTINVDADPGATTATFQWRATVGEA